MNGTLTILHAVLISLLALVAAWAMYRRVLKMAVRYNIVDHPDARKLQKAPIPVLGGVVVFLGLSVGIVFTIFLFDYSDLLPVFLVMAIMLVVGICDDIGNLSPYVRFLIEIVMCLFLIHVCGYSINDFYGLWGIYGIPTWMSLPLSIITGVGIINAINLIDGIDGYSSGYCMVASLLFGIMFWHAGYYSMFAMSMITVGALLPFFVHNVFGKTSKMFIGDGGSLMLGMVMTVFVMATLTANMECSKLVGENVGLVAFTLAVLSVPVFDTLRVMTTRMLSGKSPFSPDKTHLHHLFLEFGFSHVGTAIMLIFINLIICLLWFITYELNASINVQLYVVLVSGISVTFAFHWVMKKQIANNTKLYHMFLAIGEHTHIERKSIWIWIRNAVDGIRITKHQVKHIQ